MSKQYYTTIGLEVHTELKTASKMWCGCKNEPDNESPNTNVCPVCTAQPGSLPVANKEAIKKVITVGVAVNGTIPDFTEFDRKNYFYPDIPKGYQISQYKYPLVSGGELAGVKLTRIHLEEDTAKSSHGTGASLVDFNRAGVPLMELVTEPVIKDAKMAGAFARELQLLLRTLKVSDANIEKGQMRIEVNISVSEDPNKPASKYVEVKNIASFRSVEKAIEYETARQIEMIENSVPFVKETRGWDDTTNTTFSQRKKETAEEYRYFPDPDLPKLYLSQVPEFNVEKIRGELPELPWQKRARLQALGLKSETVEQLVSDEVYGVIFDTITGISNKKEMLVTAANYLTVDIPGLLQKEGSSLPSAEALTELFLMTDKGELSSRGTKDILAMLVQGEKESPKELAEKHGLIQKNDPEALRLLVREAIAANPNQVAEFKSGKESILMFFVGQCMKASKGSGNPGLFQELLKEELSK
jgi:aspartyl-tRNA(Asn)/glutamyl-tRNA(Gln) amidotransferase subunit B